MLGQGLGLHSRRRLAEARYRSGAEQTGQRA